MNKHILKIYAGCVVAVCILLAVMSTTIKLDVSHERSESLVQQEKIQIYPEVTDKADRRIYKFVVEQEWANYGHLIFYSVHQNVQAYLDGDAIYKMSRDYTNSFGKTSGSVWVDIPLWNDYVGKELRLEITQVYADADSGIREFYVGNRSAVFGESFRGNWFEIVVCLLTIFLGIVFCVYVLINKDNPEVDTSPALIGTFAVLIGLWKFSDLGVTRLLIENRPGMSTVSFVCLALMPVPAIMYFRRICKKAEAVIWDIVCIASELQCAAILLLQYFDILDFRQTLYSSWAMIILGLVVVLGMYILEIKQNGFSKQIRLNLFCLMLCFAGTGLDMGTYLITGKTDTSSYGILCFLGYVVFVGVSAFRQAVALASVGERTERYENQAYHDQLTGLYNRTAIEADIQQVEEDQSKVIIVNFDLNNLKKCNDTLGHEKGDVYIKESAKILDECFSGLGKVYRTGGDEFNCLVYEKSLDECKKAIAKMRELCADYNTENDEIRMSIAVGYAFFDKRIDYNFSDTMKRADKMMYQNKAELKKLELN